MTKISAITRMRFRQIRLLTKIVERLPSSSTPGGLLAALGSSPLIARSLFGFRRTFPTLEDARREAKKYRLPSHDHPENIAIHSARAEEIRPSDYPVLFHLQPIMPEVHAVLDIGGCVGNLFYSYARYLHYPPEMTWTVFEAPEIIPAGVRIADEKDERRLRFIDRLEDCHQADAVVISGALHYFDQLPPELISGLRRRPRHIFINRTPVIDGPSAVTIQDHEQYFALSPARILSRDALLRSMSEAGYDLVDEWKTNELRLRIPLHPASSAHAYSGFYFRIRSQETAAARHSELQMPLPYRRPLYESSLPELNKSGGPEGPPGMLQKS